MARYITLGSVLVVFLCAGWSARAVEVLKIMPLGDSNTRGTYPAEMGGNGGGPEPAALGAGGYRYPLQQMLTGGGYRFDFVGTQTSDAVGESGLGQDPPEKWVFDPTFDRDHDGLGGFTNDGQIAGGHVGVWPCWQVGCLGWSLAGDRDAPPLVARLSAYQPDIVLVMSGTNGMGTGAGANLQSLDRLIRAIATDSPNTRVIVSTIFDRWIAGGTARDPDTQAYNAGIPGVVTAAQLRGEHVSFVDCGSVLNRDDFCWNGVMGDGVHPNPTSPTFQKVAAVWYAGIQAVAPAPEPGTLVLLATGFLGLLVSAWRKRRSAFFAEVVEGTDAI